MLPSAHPEADAGFLIMESCSYEGMSGSNTINTATVLLETGMVPMTEPVTSLVLEAPAGLVRVTADCRDGRCERVTFENVPSFAPALDAPVAVPGLGELQVDLAYGGAFCAFVDAEALGYAIVPEEARELADLGERIRPAVAEQLDDRAPAGAGAEHALVHRLHRRAAGRRRRPQRHVVAPGRLDRSATGTATSARLAVLAARGLIGDGEDFVDESVIGTPLHRPHRGPHAGRRRSTRSSPRSPAAPGSPACTSSCSTPTTRSRRASGCPTPGGRGPVRLRVLSRADVEAALDPDALVEALADRFAALSAGEASMPPRAGVEVPGEGTVLLMGAHRHGSAAVSVKLVSLYPGHDPAHQAAIVVFDAATGTPAALMDGDAITAARTAAGSRLATRLLVRGTTCWP